MAEEFNTQLVNVTSGILKKTKVPFTRSGLKKSLMTHPYYPSLYSISETLNSYKIENRAIKVVPYQLDELPTPFLAFITIEEINTEDFVTVLEVTKDHVTYFHSGKRKIERKDFIESWLDGIVMLVESTDESKEPNLEQNKIQEKSKQKTNGLLLIGGLIAFAIGIYGLFNSTTTYLFPILYLLLCFFGLAVSTLLLIYEVDSSNNFVKNICTTGVKTNCNAVLTSSGSKFFGISWAEIGFYYFAGMSLYLMIPIPFSVKLPVLTWISVISALYMPFSIFYQYFVVKQWCKLCLAIQFTLLFQFTLVLYFGNFHINWVLTAFIGFTLCMLIPALVWNFIKPFIKKSKDLERVEFEYRRIISRQDIFEQTISDQPELIPGWEELGIIVKGNPLAENTILKVCSPACQYCSKAHEIFNKLIAVADNIKVITIYGLTDDPEDTRRIPVRYFLALAELGEKEKLEQAMDYWYLNEKPSVEYLKTKFPVNNELLTKQETLINRMVEWSEDAKIYYTPTVYWNGKKLPATYDLNDLLSLYLFN